MRDKTMMIGCVIALLAMTVLLIGAEPVATGSVQWEYGMYIESPGNFEWHTGAAHVRATNANLFFGRMGLPTDIEVNARTGRVQPLLLDHLGKRGWELVEVSTDFSRSTYWFKRQK